MSDSLRNNVEIYPIEKDVLLLPEVLIENFEQNLAKTIKPVFDAIWNATGWSGSIHYDQDGNWIAR